MFGGDAAAFEFVELLGGHEAAGHAFGGFVHEAVPHFGGDFGYGFPGLVVALFAVPRDDASVEFHPDFKFALFGVAQPPAKFHCHDAGG